METIFSNCEGAFDYASRGSRKFFAVTNAEHAGIHYGSWNDVSKVVNGFSSPGRVTHRGFPLE